MSTAPAVVSPRAAFRLPRLVEDAGRSALLRALRVIREGELVIAEAGATHRFGGEMPGLRARVQVQDPAMYSALLLRGSVGIGEAYVRGHWTADDLVAALRIVLRHRSAMTGLESGLARLSAPLLRLAHARRRNSRHGSRLNIAAHYDLGNDFYRLFLDESLTYSCGVFESEDATLAQAQHAKLDRAFRKLGLSAGQHLLEIGTGWGSMALHAARRGCRVTTTTISREQHELATARVRRAGLQDRVTVLLEDYRDLRGTHDALVSLEMVEAVGHEHLDAYFRACGRLLREDGSMLLQAITIADQHHDGQFRAPDFIKQHVFPGCHIPSVTTLTASATRASDLRLVHLEDITQHYARTLAHWRQAFMARLDEVRALGRDDEFIRGWEYYLAYSEAGFSERYLGDIQALLVKPRWSREAPLAPREAL